jgi:transposase-like protein
MADSTNTWRFKSMSAQRKRHSAQFKFNVALEAAEGLKTINQLAGEHELHLNLVSQWKRELLGEWPRALQSRS